MKRLSPIETAALAWLTWCGGAGVSIAQDASRLCQPRPPSVSVPATDEITILDPKMNSLGKPQPVPFRTPLGETQLDIPPAVVVHNFYYSGDRDFRGPVLPGGPSVVVANHPRTGERTYVEVQLLPGSPRVIYRSNSIEYDYGRETIRISFGAPLTFGLCETPKVTYTRSNGAKLEPRFSEAPPRRHLVQWIDRTGAPHVVKGIAQGSRNLLNSTADGIHKGGSMVIAPVTAAIDATPLGSLVHPDPGEQAAADRDRSVSRTAADRIRDESDFETNR